MDKIIIKNSKNADSRTSDDEFNEETLHKATVSHMYDVERGMNYIADLIKDRGVKHDWSKIDYFNEFADTVFHPQNTDDDGFFKASEWYNKHITEERHHLNANCPLDVNLIDVLEMIVDCVMAGKGRTGKVTPSYMVLKDHSILIRAYWNTIRLLDETVAVSNGEENLKK